MGDGKVRRNFGFEYYAIRVYDYDEIRADGGCKVNAADAEEWTGGGGDEAWCESWRYTAWLLVFARGRFLRVRSHLDSDFMARDWFDNVAEESC